MRKSFSTKNDPSRLAQVIHNNDDVFLLLLSKPDTVDREGVEEKWLLQPTEERKHTLCCDDREYR